MSAGPKAYCKRMALLHSTILFTIGFGGDNVNCKMSLLYILILYNVYK